jgi:hypothetical protein
MLEGLPLTTASIRNVIVPNPAVGAQWTYTFPAGYQALLLSLRCNLLTDVVVANRYLGLSFTIGGRTFILHNATPVTANKNFTLFWFVGEKYIQTVASLIQEMTLPFPIILNPGDALSSDIVNLQVGDTLDTICLSYVRGVRTQ